MGIFDVSVIDNTDMSNAITAVSINSQETDTSTYLMDWPKWHGMYRTIPELAGVIDKKAQWISGQGVWAIKPKKRPDAEIEYDEENQKILNRITGFGKDTIRDIANNAVRVATIGGDTHLEIITTDGKEIASDGKNLQNLKQLPPGTIKHVANEFGILTHYENVTRKKDGTEDRRFHPKAIPVKKIFHLPLNRIADEIHGISTIEKLQDIIKKRKEIQDVAQIFYRRFVYPVRIIEVDGDDPVELAKVKSKHDSAINSGEAIVIAKGSVVFGRDQALENVTPDFQAWIDYLQKYFVIAEGVPEVVQGAISSSQTEGGVKILYLGFEQVVKAGQIWFEDQWKAQIGFDIDLPDPPSIDPMIITNARKEGFTGSGAGDINQGSKNIDPTGANK